MRTWRVGSFSMGGTLIFLGIFLLLQQFLNWDISMMFMSWWPILFIILGIEILVYLAIHRKETDRVKYDFLSILFIGIIGTGALGFTIVQTTGLIDVAHYAVKGQEKTFDLPKYETSLSEEIKRVVVNPGYNEMIIEDSPNRETVLFGTYRGFSLDEEFQMGDYEDYLQAEIQGDTLYLNVKQPATSHFYSTRYDVQATLLIPDNVKLEVMGDYPQVTLNPRQDDADWTIVSAH